MAASVRSYVYLTTGDAWEFWVECDVGGSPVTATLTTGALFFDVLDALALALADATGVDATAAYNDTTDRVTMTLDGADFVAMSPYAAAVLGFSDTVLSGQSVTGDVGPGALVPLRAAVIDPVRVVDRAEMTTYRHGQAMATTWAAMRVRDVDLIARDTADRLGAWVTCGYVVITDDLGDVATGWVVDERDLSTQGEREEILIRRLVLVDDVNPPTATRYSGLWGALAFGWQVVYGLEIDGIPTAFVERTGGVLSGDGSLSIDDSAEVGVEVDREKGLGAGLALTAVLRDTAAVRDMLRRPSHVARLAADFGPGDDQMSVDDTTGWPASGRIYIGSETFAYGSLTGTTFDSLTGGNGNLARQYAASVGWVVTDRPTGWRGRRCSLYAYPVDPSGRVVDDPHRVFVGEVETEPLRRRDGWTLQIQPLDRVLEREIVGAVTGVVESQDGVVCYPQVELVLYIAGRKNDGTSTFAYTLTMRPFDDLTQPTVLGWPDVMARVRNEWNAAIVALGGSSYVDEYPALEPNGNYGFNLRIPLLYDSNFHVWRYSLTVNGATSYGVSGLSPWQNMPHNYGISDSFTTAAIASWADGDIRNVIVVDTKGAFFAEAWQALPCAFIRAEQPFTATADQLRLTVGGKVIDCTCDSVIADDGRLFAFNIRAKNGGYTVPGNLLGAAVRVGATVVGAFGTDLPNVAYAILTSTGAGNNSVMDTLSASQGYAIPAELLSYANISIGEGEPGTLDTLACAAIATLSAMPDKISLIDLLGGLLALRRQAIAVVPYGADDVRMMLVSTAPGTPDTVAQLTDDDLLGYAEEPAETVERLQPPNRVMLQPEGDGEPVIVQDLAAVAIEGPREWELTIPTQDRDSLVQLGLIYGQSLLYMDKQAQAIKVRIPPWIRATVGDSVALDTDFPGVFDPSTGSAGYNGNGRVVGAVRNLRNGAQTLTLLLDGHVASTAICGAFKVIEWTGTASAPATIDCYMPVDDQALGLLPTVYIQTADYIQRMIDAGGGSCVLLHYQPGVSEVTGQTVTVTAVATIDEINDPPAVVLTVSASTGVTLTADSWLTLPDLASGDGSAWQDAQAHVDDGSYWEG